MTSDYAYDIANNHSGTPASESGVPCYTPSIFSNGSGGGGGCGNTGSINMNIVVQSVGVSFGGISESMEFGVRSSFKTGNTFIKWNRDLTKSQQSWRLNNVLGKDGVKLLKTTKTLGYTCALASVGISGYQAYNYYSNGGDGWQVGAKLCADLAVIAIGVWGGPIGLVISIGYIAIDFATDGFGVSYEIRP